MNEINIENAKYTIDAEGNNNGIKFTIDGIPMYAPLIVSNRHYAEILRQVEAGTLTIEEAD